MSKDQIGAAWDRSYGEDRKPYISGKLDMGVLVDGDLDFALFPNEDADHERNQPDYNLVVTIPLTGPAGEGAAQRRVYLGAAWKRQARGSEQTYLTVKLELHKLGDAVIPGRDFSRWTSPVYARLSRNHKKKDGERSPDHILYRFSQRIDGAPDLTATPSLFDDGGGVQAGATDQAQTVAQ